MKGCQVLKTIQAHFHDPEIALNTYLSAWREHDVEDTYENSRVSGFVGRLISSVKEISNVLDEDRQLRDALVVAVYRGQTEAITEALEMAAKASSRETYHFYSVEDTHGLGSVLLELWETESMISFDRAKAKYFVSRDD